jgi:hypothetical protein
MVSPKQRRVRLTIEIEAELRQRIQIAAAARNVALRDYIESILLQAIAPEGASREDEARSIVQSKGLGIPRLTEAEQKRGLRALDNLERLSKELAATRGSATPESWELLAHTREERSRDLMRAVRE